MRRRRCMTMLAVIVGPGLPTLAGCAGGAPSPPAAAPGPGFEPIELQDYVPLQKPLPVALEPGKAVEVIEFFWYECPFCNAFEPLLMQWLGRQRPDVQFRQVPVGFTARHVATQKLFYALEELGQRERLHAKIYEAIHDRSRVLLSEQEQRDFVTEQGIDGARFVQALRSPQVEARAQAATRLVDAYDVAGVPSLGIHGRFYTSTALASTRQRLLAVADALIQRCREGR
ncbi:MAG: thiol:disulfide interchange protein DsbA/DsbL [Rubrivivax sp.]|nr:thiol:disulfide interchange protein DsbA/DsbL [Rubrivivax sp.]